MLPRFLGRKTDIRRLRLVLAALFLALALPTAFVLWQAYGQLRWEAFHLYRGQAEELTARIDDGIAAGLMAAEGRSFAEYTFLNISGDPGAKFLQRSPLSAFPVVQDLPGVLGYFQVDASGRFSSPLLPGEDSDVAAFGIGAGEYEARATLETSIQRVLQDNRLVESRETAGISENQALFDEISQSDRIASSPVEGSRATGERAQAAVAPQSERQYRKVQDLGLDDGLERKSEESLGEAEGQAVAEAPEQSASFASGRARRIEQSVLPESLPPGNLPADREQLAREVRITTFESEVDPFEFAMLGSGEFVLFRKVWREGERIVQGIVIDQEAFLTQAIASQLQAATLSGVADVAVSYGDDVLRQFDATNRSSGSSTDRRGSRELLYRSRLSSPFNSLELIFSVHELPAGPGARVLGWTSLLLAFVFAGGFLALYRLGLGQIRLARQQQDFVSSVSHELKTPLTSIRMYSEMLREGWADEDRRRQYYEFIHDESERLSRLIANVLQLASITRNQPRLELHPVAAGRLLDHFCSKISSQVSGAGFELVIEADEESRAATVEIDEDCMTQIVINLVDNALKFSRKAAVRKIEIGARMAANGQLRFSVRDFGPGIPKEQMKKIFRLFYRPESELTRETVGTGIGLAIVHQLTVAMGGRVDVLNREPGAEFGVTFSRCQA